MNELHLAADGKGIRPFQIQKSEHFPILYVEADGEATLTFHRSIDGVKFTPIQETVTFTDFVNEALYDVRPDEYVMVTSDVVLSNPQIMW